MITSNNSRTMSKAHPVYNTMMMTFKGVVFRELNVGRTLSLISRATVLLTSSAKTAANNHSIFPILLNRVCHECHIWLHAIVGIKAQKINVCYNMVADVYFKYDNVYNFNCRNHGEFFTSKME